CGRTGHYSAQCRQPRKNQQSNRPAPRHHNGKSYQGYRSHPKSSNQVRQNNMEVVQVEAQEVEEVEIFTADEPIAVESSEPVSKPSHELMTMPGKINGNPVIILIDSGATNNLCRPNLSTNIVARKEVSIQGF